MLAGDLIDDVRPDGVFVELDAKRVRLQPNNQVLANGGSGAAAAPKGGIPLSAPADKVTSFIPNQPPVSSTTAPVRTGGIGSNLGAAALGSAIRGMYGKMSQSGFQPGQEFVLAVQEGQKVGATIILGDRDVEVTLRRLSEALRQTDLQKLLNPNNELETTMRELLPDGPAPTLDKSEDENFNAQLSAYVETIKTKENVRKIMQQLQAIAPEIYQAMVAERDAYMANGLDKLQQFPVIVAVMGMAHVFGVEDYLKGQGWEQVKLNCNQYRR
jgi:pheromone shutdown protein TraB